MEYQLIINAFDEELKQIQNKSQEVVNEAIEALSMSKEYLVKLKQIYYTDEDKSISKQTRFFKYVKPSITQHIYFYKKVRDFEVELIGKSALKKEKIYDKTLKKIDKFYDKHKEFIFNLRYYPDKVDKLYFTASESNSSNNDMYVKALSYDFYECAYSGIYAKSLAIEKFKSYLDKRQHQKNSGKIEISNLDVRHPWTASSTDFVEIAYALYYSKSINNGDTTIKEIIQSLSKAFHIKLPKNYYQTIDDIKNRKDLTKFINKLEFALKNNL
ncbi:RteC domain-containing protein [Haloflavibacter putidus]|nr:RteC domain-containing protein [Haloflavibacter putidus]